MTTDLNPSISPAVRAEIETRMSAIEAGVNGARLPEIDALIRDELGRANTLFLELVNT